MQRGVHCRATLTCSHLLASVPLLAAVYCISTNVSSMCTDDLPQINLATFVMINVGEACRFLFLPTTFCSLYGFWSGFGLLPLLRWRSSSAPWVEELLRWSWWSNISCLYSVELGTLYVGTYLSNLEHNNFTCLDWKYAGATKYAGRGVASWSWIKSVGHIWADCCDPVAFLTSVVFCNLPVDFFNYHICKVIY